MRFEVSERIVTRAPKTDLLAALEQQLRKVSRSVQRNGDFIEAKAVEATFGSINRKDTTVVELKPTPDGYLAVASVHYRTSVAFWIILIVTLFSYVFWLVPIGFYLFHKKTVRTALEEIFTRLKNEFQSPVGGPLPSASNLDQLEKLASLRDRGAVTEEEYQAKKRELLAP